MRKVVKDWVKKGLRRLWGRSKQRQATLKAARVGYGKYKCEECGKICRRKDVEVDHIIAVGRFEDWELYIERLFCEKNGLRLLCKSCHKIKTKKDRKKML